MAATAQDCHSVQCHTASKDAGCCRWNVQGWMMTWGGTIHMYDMHRHISSCTACVCVTCCAVFCIVHAPCMYPECHICTVFQLAQMLCVFSSGTKRHMQVDAYLKHWISLPHWMHDAAPPNGCCTYNLHGDDNDKRWSHKTANTAKEKHRQYPSSRATTTTTVCILQLLHMLQWLRAGLHHIQVLAHKAPLHILW